MGVWEGVAKLPKVSWEPAMPDPSTAVLGVASPQGGRPAAVFFPFGHPTPYAYDQKQSYGNSVVHCASSEPRIANRTVTM
jgi:hypothetical protein